MPRLIMSTVFILTLLGISPGSLMAQNVERTEIVENAYHRARRAAELRDSIDRYQAVKDNPLTGLPRNVAVFLADPYLNEPVTLQELDSALAIVNRVLASEVRGGQGDAPGSDSVVAAAAAAVPLFAGGSTALPMLAAGAAEFFVQRAKDEVAFAFITRLRREVRDDDVLSTAFPESFAMMGRVNSETFQTLTPSLRSAFLTDLDQLPTRGPLLVRMLRPNEGVTTADDITRYFQGIAIIYERGREIRNGISPSVALSNLAALAPNALSDPDTRRALRMVGLLAREYSAAGGEPLIQELTSRDNGWMRRYFVALVARDLIRLETGSLPDAAARNTLMSLMRDREADAILLLNQIHSLRTEVETLRERAAEEIQEIRANPEHLLTAAEAVLSVLRTAPRFGHLSTQAPTQALQRFDTLITQAALLHRAVVNRDYVTVVNWIVQNPRFELGCAREPAPPAAGQASYPLVRPSEKNAEKRLRDRKEWDEALQRFRQCGMRQQYLSLATSLATAQNADEVTTALRAASSPVGSYRVKRNQVRGWFAPRTVSVIGYVGYGRYETSRVDSTADHPTRLPQDVDIGFTLPVGPELSFGIPWGAFSLFVPILDLGPAANQAIGFANSDPDPEYHVQELFSPGIGLMLNFSQDWPISAGFTVNSTYRPDGQGSGTRVLRTLLFFGIDATLFHFRF